MLFRLLITEIHFVWNFDIQYSTSHEVWIAPLSSEFTESPQMFDIAQGRIKLFGAPRQWKHFRPLFQAVFLWGGGYYPPDWVKHHAS